jgi:hypothetical protein
MEFLTTAGWNPEQVGCPVVCNSTDYKFEAITPLDTGHLTDMLELFLAFPRNIIQHKKEYFLYSFNQMVSSVGGSLGLFLGFAIYSEIQVVVCYVFRKIRKQ